MQKTQQQAEPFLRKGHASHTCDVNPFPQCIIFVTIILFGIGAYFVSKRWLRPSAAQLIKRTSSDSTHQKKGNEKALQLLSQKINQLEAGLALQNRHIEFLGSVSKLGKSESSETLQAEKPPYIGRGNNAMTAQFTLIAIVLGLVLGALLFRLTSFNWTTGQLLNHVLTALLACATTLAAIDLWIKYAWGLILYEWPLEPGHNMIYFMVGMCETGLALSIGIISFWLFCAAALSIAAIIAYIYNEKLALQEVSKSAEKLNKKNSEIPAPPDNVSRVGKALWKRSFLRQSNAAELYAAATYTIVLTALGSFLLIYPQVKALAVIGVSLGLAFAIFDLLLQWMIMLNQRIITRG